MAKSSAPATKKSVGRPKKTETQAVKKTAKKSSVKKAAKKTAAPKKQKAEVVSDTAKTENTTSAPVPAESTNSNLSALAAHTKRLTKKVVDKFKKS